MEATLNGASGHCAITRAGDPLSTGAELVLTLPPPLTVRHALETHSKRNLNVPLLAEVSEFVFFLS